jgi:hypothetical protein
LERTGNQDIQAVAVHAPRSHLINYLIFFLLLDLILGALLCFCLLLAGGLLFVRPSPEPVLVGAVQIGMGVLALPEVFLVIWVSSFAYFTMRRLVSHRPTLLVTHQGIEVRDLPVTGTTFLSWDELASISVVPVYQSFSRPTYQLCLDPKDRRQFLSRFHPLRRLFVRLGSLATGTLIHAPQWVLSESVGEIFLRIQETYQENLRTHEVHLFRMPAEKAPL